MLGKVDPLVLLGFGPPYFKRGVNKRGVNDNILVRKHKQRCSLRTSLTQASTSKSVP